MKVLLATDGSALADAALEVLLYRPWQDGTQVRVVSIVEPLNERMRHLVGVFGLAKTADDSQKRFIRLSTDLVKSYVERLKEKFGSEMVSGAVLPGWVRESLINEANSWKADVIMLGAHGHRESKELLFGSVPEYALSHARCSVEILKAPKPAVLIAEIERKQPLEDNRYLVALDDSASGEAVLSEIMARKWPARSFFKIVSVVEPLPFKAYSGLGPEQGARDYENLVSKTIEAEQLAAKKVVTTAVAMLQEKLPDAFVSGEVLEGYARDRILSCAHEWPANIIIIGANGRSGSKSVPGRVARATTIHAPCSVLVVRPAPGFKASSARTAG